LASSLDAQLVGLSAPFHHHAPTLTAHQLFAT
jgi:hypothetical protein